ncbi:hypothetical protein AB1Y20_002100 [Prymnesium parvum]|uniref:Uncharacterized protein n=1 Tax=Prymnesium parvum TaxID=97485 RepID=A0AB34JA79_PRYPA
MPPTGWSGTALRSAANSVGTDCSRKVEDFLKIVGEDKTREQTMTPALRDVWQGLQVGFASPASLVAAVSKKKRVSATLQKEHCSRQTTETQLDLGNESQEEENAMGSQSDDEAKRVAVLEEHLLDRERQMATREREMTLRLEQP